MIQALRQRHAFAPDSKVRGLGMCAPAGTQVAVSGPFRNTPARIAGESQLPVRAGGNTTP